MNYTEIGKRIRKIRKSKGMSQEKLAEKANISVTHMSHIETANAKYSMEVLGKIAKALSVSPSTLLAEPPKANKTEFINEFSAILDTCTYQEALILLDVVKSVKKSLDKYKDTSNNTYNNKTHLS